MGHTHIVLYNIIRYNLILFLLPHKAVARCTNSLRNLISAIPVENYFFFGFISFFLNIQRLFAHLKLELGEKKILRTELKKKIRTHSKGKINTHIITGKNINLIYLETGICQKFSVDAIYVGKYWLSRKKPCQNVIASLKLSLETRSSLRENILVKIREGN